MRKKWLACICLVMFAMAALPSGASEYYFQHYNVEDGLSHSSVYCALQDRRGFLWFGTKYGLNRFDGIRFYTYRLNDGNASASLLSDEILALAEDAEGRIWIGTSAGLCVYRPETDSFSRYATPAWENGVKVDNLVMDGQDNLWVTSADGVCCIRAETGECSLFPSSRFFLPTGIVVTQSGNVWALGIDGCVYLYRPKQEDFVAYRILTDEECERGTMLYKIVECEGGNLLITTDQLGARLFSPETGQVETLFATDDQGKPLLIHTALMRTPQECWLGTETGIFIYTFGAGFTGHLQKEYDVPYSLSDNAIHMLYLDREDGVWAGSFFGGLHYLSAHNDVFRRFIPRDSEGHIVGSVVREMVPDRKGNLYVGLENGGLCRFDVQTGRLAAVEDMLWGGKEFPDNVQSLLLDGDRLWIGTWNDGLFVYDVAEKRVTRHFYSFNAANHQPVRSVVSLLKASDGRLLAGTVNGLFLWQPGNQTFRRVMGHGFVHTLYEDAGGTVWIGTLGEGAFAWPPGGDIHPAGFAVGKTVIAFFEDSNKRFWVGTEGNGLFLCDRQTGEATRPFPVWELPSGIVYRILEDGSGQLWIATSGGLLRYRPADGRITLFTEKNGLPSDRFSYNSGYRDRKGAFYLGTPEGLVSFVPEEIKSGTTPLQAFFTGLQLFQEKQTEKGERQPLYKSALFVDKLLLEHDYATFRIDFAVPSYDNLLNVRYRYRLEGLDNDWMAHRGENSLYYTKLPPGDYVLYLQAATEDGRWPESEREHTARLEICVKPPVWLSGWALAGYALALMAAGVASVWRIRRKAALRERGRMRRQQAEKEKEILQAKISFFTTITHEIRTPLTLIDGCMKRLRKDPGQEENENLQIMQRNTDRLLNLVNQLLDFRKIESTNLLMHCVRLNARMLLENVCRNFTYMRSGEIPISFRADPDNEDYWVTADTEALVKIISNMLSNAMKFGERKVDVSISRCLAKDVETVRIRVSNDGPLIPAAERKRIFEPFHQYFGKHSKATIQGTGLGLPLARSLAEMNNASFYLDDQDTGSNSFVLDIPACGADERSDTPDDGLLADADGCAKDASGKAADRNTVLVVDDEPDMCRFVSSVMEGDYHVLVAHNGREAVAVLDKNIVSLIVTDVMMPVMDGIVLCQTVKSNIKYCHIPIVILTAKVSMQSHLEALEAKADAYIEKPFVAEHLLAQVRNLLLNRELLRETFVKSPYARMATVGLNRLDGEFLDKLNDYIMQHLDDGRLSVDVLAAQMNMSASTFYRKVKATTSLAPNEMIRLCRLKKSAELLAEGYSISEVTDCVGFSTVPYFTSCFLKQFGITPGEFAKQSGKKPDTRVRRAAFHA